MCNIRCAVMPHFNNILDNKQNPSTVNKEILYMYKETVNFNKSNPDILFTRADKGNITVALKKEDYISKMELSLGD